MADVRNYVALLRGINVGGKHSLPMKELTAMFAALKCSGVQTYIQSGNVVFGAPPAIIKSFPMLLSKKIEEGFGFAAPVILRTRDELAEVVRENPFLKRELPQSTLYVYFLADLPSAAAVKSLEANRSAPDEFRVIGRHIYMYLPNGMGRSKLSNAYFDSRLSTICTARNWATVKKLLEMMG